MEFIIVLFERSDLLGIKKLMSFENKKSFNENLWVHADVDHRAAEFLSQQCALPYLIAKILTTRGITAQTADSFLNPKLQNLMPDPSCLKDMDTVANQLAEAISRHEKIGIIGDYDVDGATSSAVMRKFLESLGIEVMVHIPDREEGYGPSFLAFDKFRAAGIKFVITVDCGTTAFEVLDKMAEEGFQIIVLDHHEAEARLPKIAATVNPKRLDECNDYPYLKYMAAVGVVFMTVVAINRELRRRGFYTTHPQPDLMNLLDLVALGTVCDVVPLAGLNRAYVRQGLKIMAERKNLGLKTLIDTAGINEAPSAYHLGYVIGPRINAGGRVGDPSIGNQLLCTNNPETAQKLADKLNQFNAERKDIESYVLLQAIEILEGSPQEYPIAFVYGHDWHQGVIGIVAGKLKERYNLPSFVMSVEADEVKGSARSIPGIDLGALVLAAKEKGILTKGGGHIMAAGFSLHEDKLEEFRQFAGEYIQNNLGNSEMTPVLEIDGVINLSGATIDLAEKIKTLEPFGAANPEPKIVIENVTIVRPSIIGSGHVRCYLGADFGKTLKAIAFRCADTMMGKAMLDAQGEKFHVAGRLQKDSWQGRETVQFIIEDMMSA